MSERPPIHSARLLPSVSGAGTTGGWRWHLRAIQSSAPWSGTRASLASWLSTFPENSPQTLVWIGASAGWMMPLGWATRFRQIEVFDLDRLARPLFAFRHGRALHRAGVAWQWHRVDALAQLDEVLCRWPQAVVLFDNLLGQQIYRCADGEELETWLSGLHECLMGRLWGSVHDWLSGPAHLASGNSLDPIQFVIGAASREGREILAAGRTGGGREDIAGRAAGSADGAAPGSVAGGTTGLADGGATAAAVGGQMDTSLEAWLCGRAGGHGIWQDHRTGGVFPSGTAGLLVPWRISRTHLHWLQAAWVDDRGLRDPG